MKPETEKQWNELKNQFNARLQALKDESCKKMDIIEDAHKKDMRELDDVKFVKLQELKQERRALTDQYISNRRNVARILRKNILLLDAERQEAYAAFKAAHKDEEPEV